MPSLFSHTFNAIYGVYGKVMSVDLIPDRSVGSLKKYESVTSSLPSSASFTKIQENEKNMKRTISATLLASAFYTSPAFAMCWNAEDAGESGKPVEICRNGACEVTEKVFECTSLSSFSVGYANGLSVGQDLTATPPVSFVTENGRRLTQEESAGIICNDIAGMDACAFDIAQSSTESEVEAQLSKIRQQFEAAMGIDAETLQGTLLEAGIFTGTINGVWGPETEAAFREALKIADSYGFSPNLDYEGAIYELVRSVRNWKFDPNSGLSLHPFDAAHMLVVASKRTMPEAEAVYQQLSSRMNGINLPNRAGVFTTLNGWLAVTAGMYSKTGCLQQVDFLKAQNIVPGDAYCAPIERFDPMNWTN